MNEGEGRCADVCPLSHHKQNEQEGVNFMNEASGSKKLLSLVCLIGGAILLIAALALDFMGTKASYRGALLVIGIIGVVVGMYILPTLKYHRTLVYVVFLFPLLFAFVVTVIIPLFLGLFYSFTNWNGIRYTEFVGFANYARMFKQTSFLWSILLTTLFVVFNMILVNLVAFLLALLCTSKLKGMGFFRASYFLPNLIGGIVLGYIWQFIFSNVVTQIFKGMKYSMLAETKTAFIAPLTGHMSIHSPQEMHLSWSTTTFPSISLIASTGHCFKHFLHLIHR